MSIQPLEYDSATPAGAVQYETTPSGIHITVVASAPDAAVVRRLLRMEMIFAGSVTVLLMMPMMCIVPMLTDPSRHQALSTVLVALVFLLSAIGIYCIIWQSRTKQRLRMLVSTMRQSAELFVSGDEMRIKTDGPFGSVDRSVKVGSISDVGIIRDYSGDSGHSVSWHGSIRWLLIRLTDGDSIQLLPERSDGEYRIIVSALRDILVSVPKGR